MSTTRRQFLTTSAALAAGATINGLAIFNKRAAAEGGYLALHTNPPGGLAQYYRDNVIGGPGAFVLPIDDFSTFGKAMIQKLMMAARQNQANVAAMRQAGGGGGPGPAQQAGMTAPPTPRPPTMPQGAMAA